MSQTFSHRCGLMRLRARSVINGTLKVRLISSNIFKPSSRLATGKELIGTTDWAYVEAGP